MNCWSIKITSRSSGGGVGDYHSSLGLVLPPIPIFPPINPPPPSGGPIPYLPPIVIPCVDIVWTRQPGVRSLTVGEIMEYVGFARTLKPGMPLTKLIFDTAGLDCGYGPHRLQGNILKNWDTVVKFHEATVSISLYCRDVTADCSWIDRQTPGLWKQVTRRTFYQVTLNLVLKSTSNCFRERITLVKYKGYTQDIKVLGLILCAAYPVIVDPPPGSGEIPIPPLDGEDPPSTPPTEPGTPTDPGTESIATLRILVAGDQASYDRRDRIDYASLGAQVVIVLPPGSTPPGSLVVGPSGPHRSGQYYYYGYYGRNPSSNKILLNTYSSFVEYRR